MKRLTTILGIFTLLLVSLSNAQQRWERTYGGTCNDYGYSVRQTSDGGYIVVGTTHSFGAGLSDVYLIKTNAAGDTLWKKTYGGRGNDYGSSVEQTTDGGYIVVGGSSSFSDTLWGDVLMIKTDSSGNTLWAKTCGGRYDDFGNSVHQTSDGGYIIAGYARSFSNGNEDAYLIKTNSSGDTLWTKIYGGASNDYAWSVQQTADSGYILAGWTSSFGNGADDVYLIKTNATGGTLWMRTFGGVQCDFGFSVQQTADGGYLIAGQTASFGGGYDDSYLIKTNASGDTLWTRTYGFGRAFSSAAYSAQQTTDGGYIVAGHLGHDVYLVKANASGDTLWTQTYGGTDLDTGFSVQQTSDGGYIVAGSTDSFGDSSQVYLIKTDAGGNSGVEESRQGDKETRRQGERPRATPNPFTYFATLPGHEAERFSLYDVSGRKVGTFRGDRIGEGLAPGVYFLRSSNNKDMPLRIVKVR